MEIIIISLLAFLSIGVMGYYIFSQQFDKKISLPDELRGRNKEKSGLKELLDFPVSVISFFLEKTGLSFGKLKKKLIYAGKPMNIAQFLVFKLVMLFALPLGVYILLDPKPVFLGVAFAAGLLFPDMWLNGKIKKRREEIVRDLPDIIDLLSICVGAGLDFMLAVRRVVREIQDSVIGGEFKIMLQEIQMGLSRREALKNLSARIDTPEVSSFVRALTQADRMGSPIREALKAQADELRIYRFQRGEEMALKAPIKLLFPLLVFILPVVLIIVAAPILIQFSQGGFMKF